MASLDLHSPAHALERRVLACLRDHPHDNTARLIADLLELPDHDAVAAALDGLERESLVLSAGAHWALTRRGWTAARAAERRV